MATLGIAFLALTVPQIAAVFIYVLLVQTGIISDATAEGLGFYFMLNAVTEVLTLGILLLFLKTANVGLKDLFGKVKVTVSTLFSVLTAFAGYFVTTAVTLTLLSELIPVFDADQNQDNPFKDATNNFEIVLSFVALVIIAPLAEEIIFRGFLYRALKSKARPVVAAIIASVIFGLAHLQWNVGVDTFVLSLFLIWVYEKTGTLWSAFALHALKNLIAFVAIFGPWQ